MYSTTSHIGVCFVTIGLIPEFNEYKARHPNASNLPDESDIDTDLPQEDQILLRNLGIKKGKCPEEVKGLHHKLMKMAYMPKKIETIMDTENNDLLKLFYTSCVSQAVGKRTWNHFCKIRYLSSFVTPTDEAFAMLILENNVAKWMNELRFGTNRNTNDPYKTLYTEGRGGRKWNKAGKRQFLDLWELCKEYRSSDTRKERYRAIEIMIKSCERSSTQGIDEVEFDNSDDDSDDDNIEEELLAMANGMLGNE